MARNKSAFTPALAYHALTPAFDAVSAAFGFGQLFFEEVGRLLDPKSGERIIDVGCGTGRLLPVVAETTDCHITGFDIDPRALSYARARIIGMGNAQVQESSIDALPLATGSIDAAVSTLTFHHLGDDLKMNALSEIRRVLKPGGRFLLADFGRPTTKMQKGLLYLGGIFDGRENVRANVTGQMPAMLRSAGFDVEAIRKPYHAVRFLMCR
jgi:ubiquinone/menaquinone biosynthesis C-methylase UbiE